MRSGRRGERVLAGVRVRGTVVTAAEGDRGGLEGASAPLTPLTFPVDQ